MAGAAPPRPAVHVHVHGRVHCGPFLNARSRSWLNRHGVTHIVNATEDAPCLFERDIRYLRVAVRDGAATDLASHFERCHAFVCHALSRGSSVLMHCHMGKSRSAALLAAFLLREEGMTLPDALHYVRSIRQAAAPNPGFLRQLKRYEQQLAACRASVAAAAASDARPCAWLSWMLGRAPTLIQLVFLPPEMIEEMGEEASGAGEEAARAPAERAVLGFLPPEMIEVMGEDMDAENSGAGAKASGTGTEAARARLEAARAGGEAAHSPAQRGEPPNVPRTFVICEGRLAVDHTQHQRLWKEAVEAWKIERCRSPAAASEDGPRTADGKPLAEGSGEGFDPRTGERLHTADASGDVARTEVGLSSAGKSGEGLDPRTDVLGIPASRAVALLSGGQSYTAWNDRKRRVVTLLSRAKQDIDETRPPEITSGVGCATTDAYGRGEARAGAGARSGAETGSGDDGYNGVGSAEFRAEASRGPAQSAAGGSPEYSAGAWPCFAGAVIGSELKHARAGAGGCFSGTETGSGGKGSNVLGSDESLYCSAEYSAGDWPCFAGAVIGSELNLTALALRSFPKAHEAWAHRRWLLSLHPGAEAGSTHRKDVSAEQSAPCIQGTPRQAALRKPSTDGSIEASTLPAPPPPNANVAELTHELHLALSALESRRANYHAARHAARAIRTFSGVHTNPAVHTFHGVHTSSSVHSCPDIHTLPDASPCAPAGARVSDGTLLSTGRPVRSTCGQSDAAAALVELCDTHPVAARVSDGSSISNVSNGATLNDEITPPSPSGKSDATAAMVELRDTHPALRSTGDASVLYVRRAIARAVGTGALPPAAQLDAVWASKVAVGPASAAQLPSAAQYGGVPTEDDRERRGTAAFGLHAEMRWAREQIRGTPWQEALWAHLRALLLEAGSSIQREARGTGAEQGLKTQDTEGGSDAGAEFTAGILSSRALGSEAQMAEAARLAGRHQEWARPWCRE
jgi:atypical dual specificity phosphatase